MFLFQEYLVSGGKQSSVFRKRRSESTVEMGGSVVCEFSAGCWSGNRSATSGQGSQCLRSVGFLQNDEN